MTRGVQLIAKQKLHSQPHQSPVTSHHSPVICARPLTAGEKDRAALARVVLRRGHAVNGKLNKIYLKQATPSPIAVSELDVSSKDSI